MFVYCFLLCYLVKRVVVFIGFGVFVIVVFVVVNVFSPLFGMFIDTSGPVLLRYYWCQLFC